MSEHEPEPIGDAVNEALVRVLSKDVQEKYDVLKREYQGFCRSVRRRHRGEAREAMLRYEESVFRHKVRQLLEEGTGKK
jgi:hypothetical protein